MSIIIVIGPLIETSTASKPLHSYILIFSDFVKMALFFFRCNTLIPILQLMDLISVVVFPKTGKYFLYNSCSKEYLNESHVRGN